MCALQKQSPKSGLTAGKQRNYNEVIEFLDANWGTNPHEKNLTLIKQLDKAFDNPSQKISTILVAGTNGKSLTINFTAKLLALEGLKVGTYYAPHFLTYNERLSINNEMVSNKTFTEIANDVINMAESLNIQVNSADILTMMAFIYFKNSNVDVALLEVSKVETPDATTLCQPKITAITRVTPEDPEKMDIALKNMLEIVTPGTTIISGDQSKLNLQAMLEVVESKGATWAMPIRKLAALPYPFEQLHGRCAALAERISSIFINEFAHKDAVVVSNSLLTKQKGQRGRPTLEAKRQLELNPQKTVDQYWKEEHSALPGRFELLEKEKPSILLDNASDLDAFQNLLLGIRLLHYKRPLKGLTVILSSNNPQLNTLEFLKLLRYFFKKTSGQVIVCPSELQPGHNGAESWDVEKITNEIKSMKIKARSAKTFAEAYDAAVASVDERNGLVVIAGSPSLITQYWHHKGIKKF